MIVIHEKGSLRLFTLPRLESSVFLTILTIPEGTRDEFNVASWK